MNKCFLSHVSDFHEVIQNKVTFLAKLLDRVNFSGNVRVDRAEIREGGLNSPCRSWCLRMCLAGVCGVRWEEGEGVQERCDPGACRWALVGEEARKRDANELGEDPNKLFCTKSVPQLLVLELSLSLTLPGIVSKTLRCS